MLTRRLARRAAVAASAAIALAACADGTAPSAPQRSDASSQPPAPSFNIRGLISPLYTAPGDTVTGRFIVYPDRVETFVFDRGRAVTFTPGAICDPATSTYGPGEWDRPCAAANRPVAVTVRSYTTAAGFARADFEPALRFNPASLGVLLYLNNGPPSVLARSRQIDFCTNDGVCIDEAVADRGLITFYSVDLNLYARRIKHFSGYTIAVGRSY